MSEEMIEKKGEEETTETPTPETIDDLKPKMKLEGEVQRLELYGAFIDIGIDVNALIHISKLGKDRVNRVSDVLNIGDEVTVWVEKVDPKRQQVMVTMLEPLAVEWNDLKVKQVYTGKVTRLENFGVFVDIGAEREGLVHISELSHDYVKHPSEQHKVGDEVQVQVLNYSKRKRRIDLSIKSLLEKPESAPQSSTRNGKSRRSRQSYTEYEDYNDDDTLPTAMEIAMRRALGDDYKEFNQAKKKKRSKKGKKSRDKQEDILSRTLQAQKDS